MNLEPTVQEAAETVSDNCPGIVENPPARTRSRSSRLPGCNLSYDDSAANVLIIAPPPEIRRLRWVNVASHFSHFGSSW